MELDRTETARRMRALRGYSLLGQSAFADALGIDSGQAERLMRTSGATRASEEVLRRAAEVAGLDPAFAVGVFGQVGDPASDERIALLEDQVARLQAQMPTREQLQGLIRLQLLAAGVSPAEESDDEEPRGQLPPAG